MSIILMKEQLQTTRMSTQKYSQNTVDCDLIVPDICPDVKKILEVSGHISVDEKSLLGGKAYIQGTVYMTVLYTPDGEVMSKVKSLRTSQSFNHSIDINHQGEGSELLADIEAEAFHYTLLNCRKIHLRCTIGTNLKIIEKSSFEIASPQDIDPSICANTQKLRLCNPAVSTENRITLFHKAEIPSGNPPIGEILKATVVPESSELSIYENSALMKGQVKVSFLYTSCNDGSIYTAEYTVPFEENASVPGLLDDMEAEIEYLLSDIQYNLQDDSDGEPRIIVFNLTLAAQLRGIVIYEPEIICDVYSLKGGVNCISNPVTIEQMQSNTTAQFTHKAHISTPETFPEIAKICDISVSSSVSNISINNGEATVSGQIKSQILYTTTDENIPLCSHTDISEFSHTLPGFQTDAELICEAKIFTEHISYTMNSSNSIDTRVVLGLSLRSFTDTTICPVIDIEETDFCETAKKPTISIFFVQKDDTLWSIAKKYKTTVERLMKCNNLTSDHLSIGQQIKIC